MGIVTLAVSRLVIHLWGPGVFLVGILVISLGGALLKSVGFRNARHADALLGKVWDYIKGMILVALLPALWPAVQAFRDGDLMYGLGQVAVLGLVVFVVFKQFGLLPRTWTRTARQPARSRAAGRRPKRRSR